MSVGGGWGPCSPTKKESPSPVGENEANAWKPKAQRGGEREHEKEQADEAFKTLNLDMPGTR